jgi:anti-sigma B factor antagonist
MSLSLTTRFAGDICTASLEGELKRGPMLAKLSAEIDVTLWRKPAKGLILDLGGVSDLDSAGLGELVKIYQLASARHCQTVIASANARVREMFAITRLDDLLPCHADAPAAELAVRRAL